MDQGGSGEAISARKRPRFLAILGLIALAALGLRVTYILTVTQNDKHLYDATYYQLEAHAITAGEGFFVDPFSLRRPVPKVEPSADHPPLTVLSLLPAAWIQGSDTSANALAMRFTMALFGTATVVLIGLLARRIGGDTVGLVAAGIAAFDPNLWMNDGLVMSETLAVLLTVALMYGAYRALERGTTWRLTVGLGVLSGLLILTRAELGLFVPFLVLPALWIGSARPGTRTTPARERVRCWVRARSSGSSSRRGSRSISRDSKSRPSCRPATAWCSRATNCPDTYYGSLLGYANIFPLCTEGRANLEQSVWNDHNRTRALEYMGDHVGRLPVVVLARLGRSWSLFDLTQTANLAAFEGRPTWATYLGAAFTWIIVVLAVAGGFLLRRRRTPIWPLVVPIVVTSGVDRPAVRWLVALPRPCRTVTRGARRRGRRGAVHTRAPWRPVTGRRRRRRRYRPT